jgi:phosphate transport system protein
MLSHLEESLQRDIDRIRTKVSEMSCLVEKALRDSVNALVEHDPQLAYAVILRDQYVDEKEREIDCLCVEFLVRQQPVAAPLRFASSAIKTNVDIESAGDCAESIARHALKLGALPAEIPVGRVVEMANLAIPMLHDAVQAFLSHDAELARKAIDVEDAVDTFKSSLNAELVRLFQAQRIPFEVLNPLMMIVRHLERVSDFAREICLEVLYMCTGEYARHPGADVFRVLFLDEHNSCRSQMAEAVANALQPQGFIFASAGLEPRPIDPMTLQFMKEKGFDVSRAAPKAILQVVDLDHYRVIVLLARAALRAFPTRPRKVVLLDWNVVDPSAVQGTPEQVKAAYETTYEFIQSHIRALVEAIIGTRIG